MYSLEILEKIEAIRTNLFPHPDLYREHLKKILIKPHWTGVLSDFSTWGDNEMNLGNKKPPCSRGAGLTSVHLLRRSLFSSSPPFPFSFPFPLSHFSLISSSERPLTIVSLCFCVFWGWSFHFHDTRSCTDGHLMQNDNCRCCGNKMTLGMYGWMPRLFGRLFTETEKAPVLVWNSPMCIAWILMSHAWYYLELNHLDFGKCCVRQMCDCLVQGRHRAGPAKLWCPDAFTSEVATQTFWEGHPTSIVAVIVAGHGGRGEPVTFL